MAKFTFQLPNGKFFELTGPADATLAQAERIFLEQLSSGALVGLRSGDTIESAATTIQKFALDRLDRGIAGVADLPLLAITNDGIISVLPVLGNVQVENGITTSDFLGQSTVNQPLGPLTTAQLQSLVAQAAKSADQAADVISDQGVGKYKFTSQQLEAAGYLKPGTSCRYLGLANTLEYRPMPGDSA